jgi:hypothetical protein
VTLAAFFFAWDATVALLGRLPGNKVVGDWIAALIV